MYVLLLRESGVLVDFHSLSPPPDEAFTSFRNTKRLN